MADDWEDEGFELKIPQAVKASWEDEEVEVKESWDAEDVPSVKAEKPKAAKKQVNKDEKKPQVNVEDMTEEEKKKAQEEADLENATKLFGFDKSLDEFSFNSKDDYMDYSNRLYAKLNKYHANPNYQDFLEELFKALCKNSFSDAKLAEEKLLKQKDLKVKPKAKGKLKVEKDTIKGDFDEFLKKDYRHEDEDDDDFM